MFVNPRILTEQNSRLSEAQIVEVLESEEFYRTLRQKQMLEKDRIAVQDFISRSLTNSEWKDFKEHCIENDLDPYYEMREIIFSTYARSFVKRDTRIE